jgi:hypothetical protein
VKYELGFSISEDDVLHSDCRENLKRYNMIYYLETVYEQLEVLSSHIPRETEEKHKTTVGISAEQREIERSSSGMSGMLFYSGTCALGSSVCQQTVSAVGSSGDRLSHLSSGLSEYRTMT